MNATTRSQTDEIEDRIEHTRHELGQTVEALSHKLDLKSQAQEKMAVARERAGYVASRVKTSSQRPATLLVAGGTAAAVAGFVAWRRKH